MSYCNKIEMIREIKWSMFIQSLVILHEYYSFKVCSYVPSVYNQDNKRDSS